MINMNKLYYSILSGIFGITLLVNNSFADTKKQKDCIPENIKKLVRIVKNKPTMKIKDEKNNIIAYDRYFLKGNMLYSAHYDDWGSGNKPNGMIDHNDSFIVMKEDTGNKFYGKKELTLSELKEYLISRNGWPEKCFMDDTLDGHAIYCRTDKNKLKIICDTPYNERDKEYHKMINEYIKIIESGRYVTIKDYTKIKK